MLRKPKRGRTIPALVACFYAGILVGWLLRDAGRTPIVSRSAPGAFANDLEIPSRIVSGSAPARTEGSGAPPQGAAATSGRDGPPAVLDPTSVPLIGADPIAELRRHRLQLPIDRARIEGMKGNFDERRGRGARRHEAIDILADRHTPVRAVDEGSIARLFESKAGGTTVYQFDPTGRFTYYYAHLQRYADGLHEGQRVSAGDVIGYVGTTGNAPENTPHLHFAIFEMTPEKRWWEGRPLDPYLVFRE
jgi:murein DD-endopeptidase MepM/ murein hydrolase activator NlpD